MSYSMATAKEGKPLSPSADRIRTRFLHKIGIDAPAPTCSVGIITNKRPCHKALKDKIMPMIEPLKIGLDSDDDSSLDSNDSDYFFDSSSFGDISVPHSEVVEVEYFHKSPHKKNNFSDSRISNVTHQTVSKPLNPPPLSSLPSLQGSSDESTVTPPTKEMSNLSTSSSANKKARFFHESKKKTKKKGVSLNKSVSVIPIPSRHEYSSRVRERLWSSSTELSANAARNSVEFAAEGWDWRAVLEDEKMLLHKASGELIHPIHIQNALACMSGQNDDQATLNLISDLVPNRVNSQMPNSQSIGLHSADKEQSS